MSMEQIRPSDARLRYLGRIDDENPDAPALHWVCTGLTFRVRARELRLQVSNIHHFWENRLGVIVNGQASAILLPENGDMTIDLSEQLTGGADEILVFKRQDSCHAVVIRGLEIDGELLEAPEVPARRIEFYGDSVTAGEVSEAEHCCGQVDPPHNGQYSNSYLSYAWQTARLLGAEMHNQGQGGIALLAQWLAPLLTADVIMTMSVVGSILIFGLGLKLLGILKIKVLNHVPAVFVPIALVPLFELMGM